MDKVFERSISVKEGDYIKFDMDKLFSTDNLLSEKYKGYFIDTYLFLKLAGLWDCFNIYDWNDEFMVYIEIGKDNKKIPGLFDRYDSVCGTEAPHKSDARLFLEKRFTRFCEQLGLIYFEHSIKAWIATEFTYMEAGRDIVIKINIWNKEQEHIKWYMIMMIEYYYGRAFPEEYSKLRRRGYILEHPELVRDLIRLNKAHFPYRQTQEFMKKSRKYMKKECSTKEFIEKVPFCMDMKKHLIDKGLIDKKFSLRPRKTFKEFKLEAERFFKSIYLKTNCSICGNQYVKDRKGKTTCGNYNCKILKSRIKKRMEKRIKRFNNLSSEEFYRKMVEADEQRIDRNEKRGQSCQKLSDLRKLSNLIYDEVTK